MTENMMARDAEEGIGAFIEKRDSDLGGPLMIAVPAGIVGIGPIAAYGGRR